MSIISWVLAIVIGIFMLFCLALLACVIVDLYLWLIGLIIYLIRSIPKYISKNSRNGTDEKFQPNEVLVNTRKLISCIVNQINSIYKWLYACSFGSIFYFYRKTCQSKNAINNIGKPQHYSGNTGDNQNPKQSRMASHADKSNISKEGQQPRLNRTE